MAPNISMIRKTLSKSVALRRMIDLNPGLPIKLVEMPAVSVRGNATNKIIQTDQYAPFGYSF